MPNVLFITADQWRGDTLSAVGHPTIRTPNLDALAAEGTLFRRHYTNAFPCGPARATLLTGLYPHTHRSIRNGTPLDARHTNLALELRAGGFEPWLFGYTDTSPDPRMYAPGDPVRDSYEGVLPGFVPVVRLGEDARPWLAALKAEGYPVSEPALGRNPFYQPVLEHPEARPGLCGAPTPVAAADSETAFLTDRLIEHLAVAGGRPWFVHLSYVCPHPPFAAPAPYHALYDPAETPPALRGASAAAEGAQHPLLDLMHRLAGMVDFVPEGRGLAADLSAAEVARIRACYYGLATEVDDQLGRVFAFLRESGQWDDTLIVFTSDHGEQLGDHYLLGKGGYFDQSAHIPLIVRDPRPAADAGRGRQVERFTEAVDLMPTMLDWLGLPVPPQCDGASLLPFCRGETPAGWRRAAHWSFDFRDIRTQIPETALGIASEECALQVIRDERRKYVHFVAQAPLFFDLERDPGELEDRAADPAYAGEILAYAQALLSWRMRHEDRALTDITLADGYFQRA